MSISKNKRSSSRYSSKDKDRLNDSNIIYEHVKRIDGQEVIRKHIKCGLLGRGGFANCYITENIETKRRTATKIVFKQQLKSHRTRLRLANQIKLHKALHHPNVVQFINCFQDKENVYIFLELCENQSLNQLIRIRNNFITPQIQSFLFGIVNGLKYIHSQKILHRDLKLGNIFIDSKFNIKIGDFGLATKLQFKKQCKRTVCGTPNYIAPQVLQGKGYHFEVDIWSIGVILYTLFYGIPPFQTEDANSTYQRIKQCNYIIPKYMNVPNQAISLIQKLLLKNPHERFTLDEILMSDFMKLGNGILKQLPSICSKKAPTKKQLSNTNNIKPFQQYCVNKPKIEQVNNKKDFVVEFEEILQDTFYFRLKNDLEALIEKDIRLIYKGPSNKYIIRSLTNNYEEEAKDCDFKYLFMAMSKKFNVIDTIDVPINPNGLVFINRIQRLKNGFIIRLSSENIQLLIQDSNYLIANNKVWQILNGKQKQLKLSKIANGTLKGNKNHVKIIERILSDIQNQKGSNFKQNRN